MRTSSGDRLRTALLPATAPCRGSVLLSTGRSEVIETYGEVAGELAARGFNVVLQEWVGQGLSGRFLDDPLRAHREGGAERMLANFDELLTAVHDLLPGPWIALAHSMGGGLTALALAMGECRFEAAVLSAPMIDIAAAPFPSALVKVVAAAAVGLGFGKRLARRQIDPAALPFERNALTHHKARCERTSQLHRAKPELRLGEPTWAWVQYALDIETRLRGIGIAERISCPVMFVAAENDVLVDNRAMKAFCGRSQYRTLTTVKGSYHEILMETDAVRARFWQAFDSTISKIGRLDGP